MKRTLALFICAVICFALCSCKREDGEHDMNSTTVSGKTITVAFINGVEDADIWILPQTGERKKSSLWGTATIPKLKAGERKTVTLAGADKYIVRIIDDGHAYYSANDLALGENSTVVFKTSETKYEAVIAVLDGDGKTVSSSDAFQGVLGAN